MEIYSDTLTGPLAFVGFSFFAFVRLSTDNEICCLSEQNLYELNMILSTVPDWSNKEVSLRLKVKSNRE